MPDGRTHTRINLICYLAGSSLVTGLYFGGIYNVSIPQLVLLSVGYGVGTYWITPDLDLAEQHVRAKKAWGPWGILWVPYGHLSEHRGMSHSWLWGPLSRLLYVMLCLTPIWILVYLLFSTQPEFRPNLSKVWRFLLFADFWLIFLGYYVSQWLHLVADGIWPGHSLRILKRRLSR
jgi:uncharacterized metal-binding protein